MLVREVGKYFGYHFTPDQHVTPVLRWERFNRVEGPGTFRIRLSTEEVLSSIYVGIRAGRFRFEEVMSEDNIPFTVQVVIRFRFDPRDAAPEVRPAVVRAPAEGILQTVEDRTEQALRRRASTFRAEELNGQAAVTRIEQHITNFVAAELRGMGISLGPTATIVKELSAPAKFQQTMLQVRQHEAYVQAFKQYADKGIVDQAIWAEFINGLENHNGQLAFLSPLAARNTFFSPNGHEKV